MDIQILDSNAACKLHPNYSWYEPMKMLQPNYVDQFKSCTWAILLTSMCLNEFNYNHHFNKAMLDI
jgi:hypothetical protein